MSITIDDVRIQQIKQLQTPAQLITELPISKQGMKHIFTSRKAIQDIIHGRDDRLLVIIGPCSIHDVDAALEYAQKLKSELTKYQDSLVIAMRVYFEKPRTNVGWKGLINDPNLDNSFEINHGLKIARQLLLALVDLEIPVATEFLDTITPQYYADLVSWGAIGARTTESQVHRELASGLSMPIGFKNATNGDIQVAIDAIKAAKHSHHFLSVTKNGQAAIVNTQGNSDAHVILRGGHNLTNYDEKSIMQTAKALDRAKLNSKVVVDCSHGNSGKDHSRQALVVNSISQQIRSGSNLIAGVMLESHLNAGNQALIPGKPLQYGVSITDACISWEQATQLLENLSAAVIQRRQLANDDDTLATFRHKIDEIDKNIEELISLRAQQALNVAAIKKNQGNNNTLYRPEREAQIIRNIIAKNNGPLSDEAMENIFRLIMSECLSIE